MYFHLFVIICPPKKGGALHLNKLESTSPKDPLSQVRLKLAQWFWRRRFLNFVNVFSLFVKLSPLGKGRGPSFEQTWIPFTQGCFVPSSVEIGVLVLEKKMKMWKVSRQTEGRKAISKAHLSFQLRWANKKNKEEKTKESHNTIPQILLHSSLSSVSSVLVINCYKHNE